MAAELVPPGDDENTVAPENDAGLNEQQVAALEWLIDRGHEPPKYDVSLGKYTYHKEPQVRAYQMIFQGRFGGNQPGAGRPRQRAAQSLGEYIRHKLQPKLRQALDNALDPNAGTKANLDAVRLAMDIENREAKLQLDEDSLDIDQQSKEELIGTLFALFGDRQTAAYIDTAARAIPEAVTVNEEDIFEDNEAIAGEGHPERHHGSGHPAAAAEAGSDTPGSNGHGRNGAPGDRPARANPYAEAAKRRSAERRRASSVGEGQPPG
jgi:hypothetical protein